MRQPIVPGVIDTRVWQPLADSLGVESPMGAHTNTHNLLLLLCLACAHTCTMYVKAFMHAGKGIRANTIVRGFIDTSAWQPLAGSLGVER